MAAIHAERALALVGAAFRPQGRNPDHGLDCVGLCLVAYDIPENMVRDDYRLRGDHRSEMEAVIRSQFRRVSKAEARPGDLLLMLAAADQQHLGILTGRGFVHADLAMRRVVETPGKPSWPVAGIFRLRKGKMR